MPILFIVVSIVSSFLGVTWAADFHRLNQQAEQAFIDGDYADARAHWQASLQLLDLSITQKVDALTRLAAAQQGQGNLQAMFSSLNQALDVNPHRHVVQQAQIQAQLSDAWLSIDKPQAALVAAQAAVQAALDTDDNIAQAYAFFSRANVYSMMLHQQKAQKDFSQVHRLLPQTHELRFKAALNQVDLEIEFEQLESAQQNLQQAHHLGQQLPLSSFAQLNALLAWSVQAQALAQLFKDTQIHTTVPVALLQQAENTLRQAIQHTEKTQNRVARADAYGQLGHLYETQQRYEEALPLTQQAIFFAEQTEYAKLRYRWHWQRGRILRALHKRPQAIAAYHRAVRLLQPVQHDLQTGYRYASHHFNDSVRPVYYGLADLLLQQAAQLEGEARQALLRQAMDSIEKSKVAELQNYFKDTCSAALQPRQVDLALVAPNSAVLYPIALPDRLVLLLNLGDTIHQTEVPIQQTELKTTAFIFAYDVQNRVNNRFFYAAWDLYNWLIRPVVEKLRAAQVDTLVVAPDGIFRLLPFAALHDGKNFLIEEFAVVTTPSLTLTDPHPINWKEAELLLVGLSEGVQGYTALPGVLTELSNIQGIAQSQVSGVSQILNQAYSVDSLTQALKNTPYSIIHLATHGEFNSLAADSYLLTYGEKLQMDTLQNIIGLGRFRETPLELLTLSACKTATGDDRAALGLAGVAIKAGARSALASLWSLDDEVAALMITEFYQLLLQENGMSKAKSLQQAQKSLITQVRYEHPAYWAAFLLIGSWL